MLPAKLMSPHTHTVEAGMNHRFVRTGLRGDCGCGKMAHTPAAHGGRARDIWGSICHSSVYTSGLHVCWFPCLFYILCVLPDSCAHHFPFLTPKNSILTKLYLKALSFALGPISEAWYPNKQPPSVPGHFAPSSQNAPLSPPSHWKSCRSTFADSARSVIPAAIFRSALPFHACCQNVAYALVVPLLNTVHSFRHRQSFASFLPSLHPLPLLIPLTSFSFQPQISLDLPDRGNLVTLSSHPDLE